MQRHTLSRCSSSVITLLFNHPYVYLHGGPRKLWEHVYKAISGAKHLIYIVGWSFNPKMVLIRDPETDTPQVNGVKIGELLKQKSEDGVAVRVMLCDVIKLSITA